MSILHYLQNMPIYYPSGKYNNIIKNVYFKASIRASLEKPITIHLDWEFDFQNFF